MFRNHFDSNDSDFVGDPVNKFSGSEFHPDCAGFHWGNLRCVHSLYHPVFGGLQGSRVDI